MTTTTSKPLCITCKTERGIFKCDGCSQMFCLQHTTNHHQDISKQLDQVEMTCDLVQKMLNQQSTEPRQHVEDLREELTKKVDEWERESIIKIQKVAEETRNDLFQYTTGYLTHMKIKLEQLTSELNQGRQSNGFVETDLREWEDKLRQLQEELINPLNVVVREDCTTLVTKIRANVLNNNEVFERTSGNADFEENGKVVYIKNGPDIYTEVRGKVEYMTGHHTLCFKVEQLHGWILCGIISKSTPLQIHSYISPSCYGWYNGEHFNYSGGQCVGGHGHDVIENDTISLFIDCDNRSIRLTNERTNRILELRVDLDKCPFPWQLHFNLNLAPTRIRILS